MGQIFALQIVPSAFIEAKQHLEGSVWAIQSRYQHHERLQGLGTTTAVMRGAGAWNPFCTSRLQMKLQNAPPTQGGCE